MYNDFYQLKANLQIQQTPEYIILTEHNSVWANYYKCTTTMWKMQPFTIPKYTEFIFVTYFLLEFYIMILDNNKKRTVCYVYMHVLLSISMS